MRRKPHDSTMGRILTTITITNRLDQGAAARKLIPADAVRSVTLPNVWVDTGATTLGLPRNVIEQLGLELLKEVDVATATGIGKPGFFKMLSSLLWDEKEPLSALSFRAGKIRFWA
jgi:hypothetical protein